MCALNNLSTLALLAVTEVSHTRARKTERRQGGQASLGTKNHLDTSPHLDSQAEQNRHLCGSHKRVCFIPRSSPKRGKVGDS